MIATQRTRKNENLVYLAIWAIVMALYVIDKVRNHAQMSQPLIDIKLVGAMMMTMLPYMLLFAVNNYCLIPRLLLKNRVKSYLLGAAAIIAVMWVYQYINFVHIEAAHPAPDGMPIHAHHPPQLHPGPRPLLPLPLFLDFTYGILVIGCNVAVALVFQRYYDRLERESYLKANAENELAYLKAQINPHFYMNMLNNIHGMIEINPERAQSMVIDMSKLMRYMLYESSKKVISLGEELDFLRNYIELMRLRYAPDKVTVTTNFPRSEDVAGIELPPLLFLVFIENAFKHGISYRNKSFVTVSIEISGGELLFGCVNSYHPSPSDESSARQSGIGLRNIRQRLRLLYGDTSRLEMTHTADIFMVNLSIPCNEIKDTDNRR